MAEEGRHVQTPSYMRLVDLLDAAVTTWKTEYPEGDSIAFEFASLEVQAGIEDGQFDG